MIHHIVDAMFVLDLHRVYQNLNSVTSADLLFTSDRPTLGAYLPVMI